MKPLNIILDTSILSSDKKLSGSNFLLLKKLSQLGFIKLHIPWVVYKEFTTQNILEITEDINKALKSFRSINQKGLAYVEQSELNSCYSVIKTIKNKISHSVEKNWDDFIKESKAIIHAIEDSHGNLVMNSYFNKSKPFSSLKNKSDIPDAFVYESVCCISKSIGNAIFVCNDKNLRGSFKEFSNINTYESLIQLFNSVDYKPIETEYKKKEHYAFELIEIERQLDKIQEIAESRISMTLESFINSDVKSDHIPSIDNKGTIVNLEDINSARINKDDIIFVDDVFYIKVYVLGSIRIEYTMLKSDYYVIEDRNNFEYIDYDWNEFFSLIGESYNFELSFDCTISKDNVHLIDELYNKNNLDLLNSQFLIIDEESVSFNKLIIT